MCACVRVCVYEFVISHLRLRGKQILRQSLWSKSISNLTWGKWLQICSNPLHGWLCCRYGDWCYQYKIVHIYCVQCTEILTTILIAKDAITILSDAVYASRPRNTRNFPIYVPGYGVRPDSFRDLVTLSQNCVQDNALGIVLIHF